VKDSALVELVPVLCKGKETKVFLHTAGSVPMDVFQGMALHYGVLYPMQTFSKQREVDFSQIPCFIEANDEYALQLIGDVAHQVSSRVYHLASEDRKYLHFMDVGLPWKRNPYREFIRSFGGKPVAKYRWFRCNIGIINRLMKWIYKL
jgi:hypothetical protein